MFEIVSDKEIQKYKNLKKENIILPQRKTLYSAGYDIHSPFTFKIYPQGQVNFPTGLKCRIPTNMVLKIYPRSSFGIRYKTIISNIVGIIDSDYYNNSENEGHILMSLLNLGDRKVNISVGDAVAQAILEEYYTFPEEKIPTNIREGGIGSTTNKEK